MKKVITFALLAMSSIVHANVDFTGAIQAVYSGPAYGGIVFLQVGSGTTWGTAACNTNTTWQFAFDSNSPAGKVTLAQILTAYAAEKTVRLVSQDLCTVYSGIPNLDTVTLK